ncbi:MAG: hypothetical protein M9926_07770 [Lentimicrobium sp.]|uniref:hypothetical protein n=1 Tax=Lentimicrobium sp. TaxID=2034841 RepID=UPI0025E3BD6C|nr:hypothetical protein [Lentimicrobium sp.]MCO5256644.1 hypothetical protein [Lentimicrobium sp.]
MRNTFRIILITLTAFGLYYFLQQLFFRDIRHWMIQSGLNAGVSHLFSYLITGIPLFAAVLIIHGPRKFAGSLGLNGSAGKGFVLPCYAHCRCFWVTPWCLNLTGELL